MRRDDYIKKKTFYKPSGLPSRIFAQTVSSELLVFLVFLVFFRFCAVR